MTFRFIRGITAVPSSIFLLPPNDCDVTIERKEDESLLFLLSRHLVFANVPAGGIFLNSIQPTRTEMLVFGNGRVSGRVLSPRQFLFSSPIRAAKNTEFDE